MMKQLFIIVLLAICNIPAMSETLTESQGQSFIEDLLKKAQEAATKTDAEKQVADLFRSQFDMKAISRQALTKVIRDLLTNNNNDREAANKILAPYLSDFIKAIEDNLIRLYSTKSKIDMFKTSTWKILSVEKLNDTAVRIKVNFTLKDKTNVLVTLDVTSNDAKRQISRVTFEGAFDPIDNEQSVIWELYQKNDKSLPKLLAAYKK